MGRFSQRSSDDSNESEIDISPLMDCVFILLIFFIVTTTFVEEEGIEVDKPQAASTMQSESKSIVLALTEQGEVLHNGQDIGFSGIQPLVKNMLKEEDAPVLVQADENSPTSLLVRVIDEAEMAGDDVKVSISTRQKAD